MQRNSGVSILLQYGWYFIGFKKPFMEYHHPFKFFLIRFSLIKKTIFLKQEIALR
jgi:hypothetical protein